MAAVDTYPKTVGEFHDAIKRCDVEMVEGVDVKLLNAGDEHGFTGVMWAAWLGHVKIGEVLIQLGADLEKKDCDGQDALYHACWQGEEEFAKLLLDNKVDLSSADVDGETPLMAAAHHGYVAIVKLLLAYGADLKATDRNGLTARAHSIKWGHEDALSSFLETSYVKTIAKKYEPKAESKPTLSRKPFRGLNTNNRLHDTVDVSKCGENCQEDTAPNQAASPDISENASQQVDCPVTGDVANDSESAHDSEDSAGDDVKGKEADINAAADNNSEEHSPSTESLPAPEQTMDESCHIREHTAPVRSRSNQEDGTCKSSSPGVSYEEPTEAGSRPSTSIRPTPPPALSSEKRETEPKWIEVEVDQTSLSGSIEHCEDDNESTSDASSEEDESVPLSKLRSLRAPGSYYREMHTISEGAANDDDNTDSSAESEGSIIAELAAKLPSLSREQQHDALRDLRSRPLFVRSVDVPANVQEIEREIERVCRGLHHEAFDSEGSSSGDAPETEDLDGDEMTPAADDGAAFEEYPSTADYEVTSQSAININLWKRRNVPKLTVDVHARDPQEVAEELQAEYEEMQFMADVKKFLESFPPVAKSCTICSADAAESPQNGKLLHCTECEETLCDECWRTEHQNKKRRDHVPKTAVMQDARFEAVAQVAVQLSRVLEKTERQRDQAVYEHQQQREVQNALLHDLHNERMRRGRLEEELVRAADRHRQTAELYNKRETKYQTYIADIQARANYERQQFQQREQEIRRHVTTSTNELAEARRMFNLKESEYKLQVQTTQMKAQRAASSAEALRVDLMRMRSENERNREEAARLRHRLDLERMKTQRYEDENRRLLRQIHRLMPEYERQQQQQREQHQRSRSEYTFPGGASHNGGGTYGSYFRSGTASGAPSDGLRAGLKEDLREALLKVKKYGIINVEDGAVDVVNNSLNSVTVFEAWIIVGIPVGTKGSRDAAKKLLTKLHPDRTTDSKLKDSMRKRFQIVNHSRGLLPEERK
ncbi:Pfs, NACHT and Ankyrin domain protein [Diplonema papillatum]|nr:Pfs, NACHT and Ankyrin domain protein [Diplonema papillatum]